MKRRGDDLWINVSQLRTHLSRIVREVERGRTFTVVRSGREVARVVGLASRASEASELAAHIEDEQLPLPPDWQTTISGKPMPNVVRAIRLSRDER